MENEEETSLLMPGEKTLEKRKAMVMFIRDYIQEHGYSPSVKDLFDVCGTKSTGVVNFHLWKLCDMGVLGIVSGRSRTVHLTDKADEFLASEYSEKPKQREGYKKIAAFIRDFVNENGYSPTFQEVANGCGLKYTSQVAYGIDRLVEVGAVTMVDGKLRTLRPTDKTDAYIAGEL